ncbi:MAG: universal stress protein [Halanaeroarchaeum sp.]
MFDTVVIATDGSESVRRSIRVALDLAERFDVEVHALSVIEDSDVASAPDPVSDQLRDALERHGEEAVEEVVDAAGGPVETAVRAGRPAAEISAYAREVDADLVATGTRGRHGENRLLLGTVAERVVQTCPVPVLTVRQLTDESAG